MISRLPTALMRPVAQRYFAGETLAEALAELEDLRGGGYRGILDILGEDVTDEAEARAVAAAYVQAAEALHERSLDTYVSIKPTHLGLKISEALAAELYLEVGRRCRELSIFMRVEMEDSPTTDATLRLFEGLRAELDNVGIVLQSRLFRTPGDIEALAPGPLNVRLVKGIYLEPESIAHTTPGPIREAYVQAARSLWDRGAFLSLATHDDLMAETLFGHIAERGLGHAAYEMAVLMGVRESLWNRWRAEGHPVRVYVPYGREWRAYSTRRLHKNPELFRAILRNSLSS